MTAPFVLVLAPPRFIGPLGVMRSLRPLGVRVYGLRHDAASIASASRFCAGTIKAGTDGRPTGYSDAEIVEQLLAAGAKLGTGTILIAGSDEWSVFVARHAGALAPVFRFPQTPLEMTEKLSAKDGLYELATRHGVPTPRILVPRDEDELERIAPTLQFPVMLKPVVSRPGRQGLELVERRDQLLPRYRLLGGGDILCQEYIPGTDEDVWIFNGYFDSGSRCLAAFTGQKIRQHPAHMGLCAFGVCRQNAEVIDLTQSFLARIGYQGVVDIGYRFDRRDGRYKVLDINPRLGGAFRLFVDAHGLDVARAMYLDLTGQPVPELVPRDGRKWMLEAGELLAYRHYRRDRGLTVWGWARSLHGLEEGATWSLSDPLPFLIAMRILATDTFGERVRRRTARARRPVSASAEP